MMDTFIIWHVPSKNDLPLGNTILDCFSIMVQQYS